MGHTIQVLLVDDHKMLRTGLRRLLEGEPGVEVVGEAGDGRTAVEMAGKLRPDVVVMDIVMPDLNGLEATRQLTAQGNGPKVIAVSVLCDSKSVQEMLRAGAMAYVCKESAFEEIVAALRAVMANERYVSPKMTAAVLNDLVRGMCDGPSTSAKLSPREREVVQLLAEGQATKQVAMHLHVSIKTIETHRRRIMDKLALGSVAELTKYAIREGITSVDN